MNDWSFVREGVTEEQTNSANDFAFTAGYIAERSISSCDGTLLHRMSPGHC